MGEDFDYDRWYPEVPAVMHAKQLAELLQMSDQIEIGSDVEVAGDEVCVHIRDIYLG